MISKFDVIYLKEAKEFLDSLDSRAKEKVLYNIRKTKIENDPKLFKKIENDIWEFRTKYLKQQIRLFAFWDKRDRENTLVIATHGIIKKRDTIEKGDIEKAIKIKQQYLNIP